eukprot:6191241-Pleurochrysis_carterae.AAC.2
MLAKSAEEQTFRAVQCELHPLGSNNVPFKSVRVSVNRSTRRARALRAVQLHAHATKQSLAAHIRLAAGMRSLCPEECGGPRGAKSQQPRRCSGPVATQHFVAICLGL